MLCGKPFILKNVYLHTNYTRNTHTSYAVAEPLKHQHNTQNSQEALSDFSSLIFNGGGTLQLAPPNYGA